MKIAMRNRERCDWMSGYGVINRALADMHDADEDEADVHFFASPPYSFQQLDPDKFNVGLTMTERHHLKEYGFDFIGFANKMDLLITPSTWCKQVFQHEVNRLKPPIEVVALGHDHKAWTSPKKARPGRSCLILDRGRDHRGAQNEAAKYFQEVEYVDCRTPKPTSEANKKIIQAGRYTQDEIKQMYRHADVFLKWGREGWCFPILEAMSANCLVITNCVHLAYIEHEKNCLVFRDVPTLNRHLKAAANNDFRKLRAAGFETAKALTWEKTKQGIREAIVKHYGG